MKLLRIGSIFQDKPRRSFLFIVAKSPTDNEELVFHLGPHDIHLHLAFECSLDDEDVLGGGELKITGTTLHLQWMSKRYGGVPNEFLQQLAPELTQMFGCKKIHLNMWFHQYATEKDWAKFGIPPLSSPSPSS